MWRNLEDRTNLFALVNEDKAVFFWSRLFLKLLLLLLLLLKLFSIFEMIFLTFLRGLQPKEGLVMDFEETSTPTGSKAETR